MSNRKRGKGVKLARRPQQPKEETMTETYRPPGRSIYESVVHDLGFDPLKERAARRT